MARPRELLLGVKQPGEIHRGIGIAEKLWSCNSERVNGGEGGRHAGGRIRTDRSSKLRGSLSAYLKADRRGGLSRGGRHPARPRHAPPGKTPPTPRASARRRSRSCF